MGRVRPYMIWKFAHNQELAKQFLVDLVLNDREAFVGSEFYNLPAFPAAIPHVEDLVASDYGLRGRTSTPFSHAAQWSTNLGYPGHMNAAVDEVFNQLLIPRMFAAVARGEMTPEEAVRRACPPRTSNRWRS